MKSWGLKEATTLWNVTDPKFTVANPPVPITIGAQPQPTHRLPLVHTNTYCAVPSSRDKHARGRFRSAVSVGRICCRWMITFIRAHLGAIGYHWATTEGHYLPELHTHTTHTRYTVPALVFPILDQHFTWKKKCWAVACDEEKLRQKGSWRKERGGEMKRKWDGWMKWRNKKKTCVWGLEKERDGVLSSPCWIVSRAAPRPNSQMKGL